MVEGDGVDPQNPDPKTPKSTQISEIDLAKKALGYLELDLKDKTFEQVQDEINEKWIKKNLEIIRGDDKLFGQLIGAKSKGTTTAAYRALKENNIPFTEDEFKEQKDDFGKMVPMKLETVVETAINKTAKVNAAKIQELEAKLSTGTDERITKLQSDFDALNTKYTEATGKLGTIEQEWTGKLTEKEKEISSLALKTEKERSWGGFKWASGAKELEKEGFQSKMEKTYEFVFDESKKLVPMKDGKRIPNPDKKDSFYETDELLKMEGIKAGVFAISPHNGQTPPKKQIHSTEGTEGNQNPNGLKINPLRPQIRVQG